MDAKNNILFSPVSHGIHYHESPHGSRSFSSVFLRTAYVKIDAVRHFTNVSKDLPSLKLKKFWISLEKPFFQSYASERNSWVLWASQLVSAIRAVTYPFQRFFFSCFDRNIQSSAKQFDVKAGRKLVLRRLSFLFWISVHPRLVLETKDSVSW